MAMFTKFFYAIASFLRHVSITIAAPASAISPDPTLSLTQFNASMITSENPTSRFAVPCSQYDLKNTKTDPAYAPTSAFLSTSAASFCARTGLLQAPPQRYTIRLPGTRTVLDVFYCADLLLNPDAMERTLDTAYTTVTNHINAHGDGPMLPPAFDPYQTPRVPEINCTVAAHSMEPSYRLTFQIMLNTLRFFYEFLYDSDRFGSTVVRVADGGVRDDMQHIGAVYIGPLEDTVSETTGILIRKV